MKTVEINEKNAENQGVIHAKLLISHLTIALEYQMYIKVMLRHSTLTLWVVIKGILFEYS